MVRVGPGEQEEDVVTEDGGDLGVGAEPRHQVVHEAAAGQHLVYSRHLHYGLGKRG